MGWVVSNVALTTHAVVALHDRSDETVGATASHEVPRTHTVNKWQLAQVADPLAGQYDVVGLHWWLVGEIVGDTVGPDVVGEAVGEPVGDVLGDADGEVDGFEADGTSVGDTEGDVEGIEVDGNLDGDAVGEGAHMMSWARSHCSAISSPIGQ